MRLRDKVALITGAGNGQGKAAALLFAREGARLQLIDWDGDAVAATARTINDAGGTAHAVAGDVGRAADAQSTVEATLAAFGRLDILYNNAGIFWPHKGDGPLHLVEEEVWDRVMATNLKGVYLFCKYALPPMMERRSGNIINTSSVGGLRGSEFAQAYSATKGAVITLTKGLAVNYGKYGIRANAICPGGVDTEMLAPIFERQRGKEPMAARHPIGRLGTPEDVARLALFLASDDSSWMTGSILTLDGGMTAR
jgi:NAD(P)-dependent dehydrogenase (short-subunit alcohol dehydrogenase family)